MKQIKLTLAAMLLLVTAVLPSFAQVSNDNEDGVVKMNSNHSRYDYVNGQVLVKFCDKQAVKVNRSRGVVSTNVSQITKVLQKYGVGEMDQLLPQAKATFKARSAKAFNGETIKEHDLSQLYEVKLSAERAHETMQLINDLQTLDEVEFAEPNYRLYALDDVTIDGLSGGNPYATSQWYLEAYGVTSLWNKRIVNPARPVIAILDTGVDITHPDLIDNIWTNARENQGEKGYDNDNNGFNNDLHGWDFINNTPNIRDFNMHGTHVAGIAAASNNGIGIVGANPKALIMPVTVMQSDGSGDVATIIKGINYAVANGATILNMSLGTYANSRALRQALENAYQKAVIVAAAGNDGRCVNTPHHPIPCLGAAPMFPAAYSFVLGVQATTKVGSLAGFSNYDDDGNTFSSVTTLQDPDGFNYELKAPGAEILSTIPGGKYKVLQGTSMAAPLVAGAISALTMVKDYSKDDGIHQEILWGDLLHTNNIAEAYAVANRPAELDLMKIMYRERKELSEETEEDYGGDGEIDAGETVSLYPVIRTTFGAASNIKMKLEIGDEYEDPDLVTILTPDWVNFGLPLSAYAKGVSLNPMQLRVASNVADNRHIKMKFTAKCDETNTLYEGHFTIVVNNMVKINGLISEDRTLTADHVYYVNENLAVMNGVTLTIEPGTRLEFAEGKGLSCAGTLIANGIPGKPIVFTKHKGTDGWDGVYASDVISYCIIEYASNCQDNRHHGKIVPYLKDCVVSNIVNRGGSNYDNLLALSGERINYFYNDGVLLGKESSIPGEYSNYVDNSLSSWIDYSLPGWNDLNKSNYFNNYAIIDGKKYALSTLSGTPTLISSDYPSYLGTSNEINIRPHFWEIGNAVGTYGKIDLSNMPTLPYVEAHGIVWKVVVNGYDAQDEYEDLAPLGVGKHKFEVYFNRPMNKAVAPQISFGVRDPWTQNAVAEDGSWNEEGTIYTAYKTINGKTKSDGINRIYVRGAEDDEFFEIPYEKTRFNVMINAAGSMATGFAAEAGMGRVNLTWDNSHNDFEDAMGFNVYRYTEGNEETPTRLNEEIIDVEATSYTDYDVTPGTTYYYYYKVLSTDLKEYDISNVVASTPLTASLGDANGDGSVNVMDVTSTVDYIVGNDPKPFVFEAADMNTDKTIDVLDVVGIVNKILSPNGVRMASSENAQEAVYTIENGMLYIETPVALAGLQLLLSVADGQVLTPASSLKGFEQASTWFSENDYQLLAYNLGGRQLEPGKHAILDMGDAEISSIRLSDRQGRLVRAVPGQGTTGIKDAMGSKVKNVKGIYNLNGQKITNASKLQHGVYIINGQKVVK